MEQILRCLHAMCRQVGTPVAQRVLEHARAGEWVEIQSLKLDPASYPCSESYWRDALCVDLVRKLNIGGSSATARAAVETFLETERDCYAVNRRIRTLVRPSGGEPPSDLAFADFLVRWRKKVWKCFGKLPEILEPRFSGGATTATTRLRSTTLDKLSTTPTYYAHGGFETSLWFWSSLWGRIACERNLPPRISEGNEYFTVPKNGLTDRSCCKEASISGVLQLAIGEHLRRRIHRILGIDLDVDHLRHQNLAREGSVFGDLATLDMSSASDRWSREIVRFLVPDEWADVLNATRATHTLFGGRRLYLEKFSSMGNGYTFELETILFATLAQTVQDEERIPGVVSCYGDDLIVPTALAIPVLARLRQVGHKPNLRKTFIEGPFRESCGGDFFNGVAVNTVKLEEIPREPHQWISFANNVRRVTDGRAARWRLLRPLWRLVLDQIPSQIRSFRGPARLGDVVIHDEPEHWPVRESYSAALQRAVLKIPTWKPVTSRRSFMEYRDVPTAQIGASLLSASPLTRGVLLRKVEGYRMGWVELGPESDWLPNPWPTRHVMAPCVKHVVFRS